MKEIDVSNIMIDAGIKLHSNKNCPICNKEMITIKHSKFGLQHDCPNKCYSFTRIGNVKRGYYGTSYNVFGHIFHIGIKYDKVNNNRLIADIERNKIRKLIQYFKENDRYLAEILIRQ